MKENKVKENPPIRISEPGVSGTPDYPNKIIFDNESEILKCENTIRGITSKLYLNKEVLK